MTRYTALTTCNAAQWKSFGRAMATTFNRHWPKEVQLLVYAEGFEDGDWVFNQLDVAAPWLSTWKTLHRSPLFNGGSDRRDYRRDAVRFSHKIAALGAAAETAECSVLIWIDADVVTHAPVTIEWLDSLFPEPAVVAWLDRDRAYPECGYLMFRMPAARKVIATIVKAYRNGAIFNLPEWHDSYILSHFVKRSGVPVHSLSGPEGRRHIGHPWVSSRLAETMDHLKGSIRKERGSSLKQDLRIPRPEPYWQGIR